jgi:hypothetical protein
MLESGVPVGMGTDATRVASYNPWVGIYWLVTGKTVGGMRLYPSARRINRETALRLYTEGSAWFSSEQGRKGAIKVGQYADLAALDRDMMNIAEDDIKDIRSVLTMVGGKVVYADSEFSQLAPPVLPISPDWSPVKTYGGYQHAGAVIPHAAMAAACGCGTSCNVHGHAHGKAYTHNAPVKDLKTFWGALGCACFA